MSMHSTTAPMQAHGEEHVHVHGSPKIYLAVFAALIFLTVVTVAASYINWGSGLTNVIIAMFIASLKGSLVALFFMHLRWEGRMNAIIFCVCLFFLGLFLIGCYTDLISREPAEPTNLKSRAAPGGQPGLANAGVESKAPPIPGASQSGSHGGAAAGTNAPVPSTPH